MSKLVSLHLGLIIIIKIKHKSAGVSYQQNPRFLFVVKTEQSGKILSLGNDKSLLIGAPKKPITRKRS